MTQATAAKPAPSPTPGPTPGPAPAPGKTTIEDVGPARKRLTITIPASIVTDKLEESMGTMSNNAALPGFRKGKVPRNLIERRFGSDLRNETRTQLIAKAYAAAIEENKLKPVGEPEPVEGKEIDKIEIKVGESLTFSVEVEVVPDFEMPKLDDLTVKKPMLEITEEHIAGELKRQQTHLGKVNKIDGGFTEGDRLGGYATVTKNDDKDPFFRQDNVLVVYPGDDGKGQVLGLMIDNLLELLKGKTIGDTITIDTTGPEMHERLDIRGAKLAMTYEIRGAERVTPITPDEVAAQYGLENEAMLREQIKMALEHRRDEEQAAAMREQAVEQVAESVKMDLPEKLSARQAASTLERQRLQMLYMGMSPEEADAQLAEIRGESESASRQRLKTYFLLHRLAEQFGIDVSEQEVNGRIAAIAAQRNVRPDKLRSELAQNGQLGEVASQLRDQKTADRLVKDAKKTEVSADEWNKIVTAKKEKAAGKKSGAKPSTKAAKADDDDGADDTKPAAKKKTAKKK